MFRSSDLWTELLVTIFNLKYTMVSLINLKGWKFKFITFEPIQIIFCFVALNSIQSDSFHNGGKPIVFVFHMHSKEGLFHVSYLPGGHNVPATTFWLKEMDFHTIKKYTIWGSNNLFKGWFSPLLLQLQAIRTYCAFKIETGSVSVPCMYYHLF